MTTGGPGGGRGLQADPAGADDGHPLRGGERRLQCVAVGDSAQVMHTGQVRTGHLEAPGRRTRRQQQLVVAERLSLRCAHFVCSAVDFGNPCTQTQVDVVFGVPLRGMDVDLFPLGAAQQVALRQGRSVIRAVILIADEDDLAVETVGAQRLGGLGAGQPGAHDDKCLLCTHVRLLLVEWAASCSRAAQPNPVAVLASRGPSWRGAPLDWPAKPSIVRTRSARCHRRGDHCCASWWALSRRVISRSANDW